MSSSSDDSKNFDKKKRKYKITTINLDVTSSSSSSSSSSNSSPKKMSNSKKDNHNKIHINTMNKISPPKIKLLFSDSDDEENEDKKKKLKKEDEDLAFGFERALNKNQFQGEKGKMLLKLQNTYVNDSRFKLDSKFKDDINYNKLPSELKENKKNNYFNYEEIDKEAKDEDIEFEKKKNMSILAKILPNSAFLEHKSIDKPTNKLLIKRYDPKLKLGDASVEAIKMEKKQKKEKEKNLVRLEKGVKIFNDKNDMELFNKYNDIDKMKKREKEKLYSDTINRINDEMNQEIIVNYDSWKKGIFEKTDNNFSLFGNNNANSNNNNNNFSLFGDNKNGNDDNQNSNVDNKNNDSNNKSANNDKVVKKEKTEKEILRKKKKREKEKLRRKEKERIKKAKIKHKKEKMRKKMEMIDKEYESELIKEFGEEKASNYLRYIEMIREKKNQKKNK